MSHAMPRYAPERKEALLRKLLPPHNLSVAELARQEGICEQTLYNWRKQAKLEGRPVPGHTNKSEQWSAEAKLATVIETATLSEAEILKDTRSYPLSSSHRFLLRASGRNSEHLRMQMFQ